MNYEGKRLMNIEGQVFGALTAVRVNHRVNTATYWLCDCLCGETKIVPVYQLNKGRVTHCGCERLPTPIRLGILDRLRYFMYRYGF